MANRYYRCEYFRYPNAIGDSSDDDTVLVEALFNDHDIIIRKAHVVKDEEVDSATLVGSPIVIKNTFWERTKLSFSADDDVKAVLRAGSPLLERGVKKSAPLWVSGIVLTVVGLLNPALLLPFGLFIGMFLACYALYQCASKTYDVTPHDQSRLELCS